MADLNGWQPYARPSEGDLRVWYSRSGVMYQRAVPSVGGAKRVIDAQAQADLADPAVTVNAFGLERYEPGGWHEWYDDDGHDIAAVMDYEGGEYDEGEGRCLSGTCNLNDVAHLAGECHGAGGQR